MLKFYGGRDEGEFRASNPSASPQDNPKNRRILMILRRGFSSLLRRNNFVGGNWKCNPSSIEEVHALVDAINTFDVPQGVDVVVAPSQVHAADVARRLRNSGVKVSIQDLCTSSKGGAHTGETSASQCLDIGMDYALVGHSERRANGESSAVVASKAKVARESGLSVIACIGETIEEREAGSTLSVVTEQLDAYADALEGRWENVVLAYEPVWAIGTGLTATPDQAQEVHAAIRDWIPESQRDSVRIIYGGSVTADTADELASRPDVDGFLVGGASLKPVDFLKILKSLSNCE